MNLIIQGSKKEVIDAIETAKNIFIFHHINPDGDCLGAQFGLKNLININYPNKKVFCLGNHYNIFEFMDFKMDLFSDIDPNLITNESLAIVVDANYINRIECGNILINANFKKKIRIDHHPNGDDLNTNAVYVNANFVACCEQILDLAQTKKWKLNKQIANYLYLGINTDSGRFGYANIGVRTFNLIAWLFEQVNFDYFWINKNLMTNSENNLRFYANVLSNFEIKNKVCWYVVTKKILTDFSLTENEASYVNLIANIDDCLVWLFFIEKPDNKYRCRIRSSVIKINQIANQFGGGGHDYAAGVVIDCNQKNELLNAIFKEIKKYEISIKD